MISDESVKKRQRFFARKMKEFKEYKQVEPGVWLK